MTKAIHDFDELCNGSKGLVFIGDKLLVYRRDENTKEHPLLIDVPGGGRESNETPFMTFAREVKEEFGLLIKTSDVVYCKKYKSIHEPEKNVYFIVVRLPKTVESSIEFGDEGSDWMLMKVDEYLHREDAWKIFQERTKDYLNSLK